MSKMVCKKVVIEGKVQGVGFRYHATEQATKASLLGWVTNLSNGSVEIIVAGPKETVEAFIKWAHKGPPTADVKSVDVSNFTGETPKHPFFIKR